MLLYKSMVILSNLWEYYWLFLWTGIERTEKFGYSQVNRGLGDRFVGLDVREGPGTLFFETFKWVGGR